MQNEPYHSGFPEHDPGITDTEYLTEPATKIPRGEPWGFWPTLLIVALVLGINIFVQTILALSVADVSGMRDAAARGNSESPDYEMGIVLCLSTPFALGAIALAIFLKGGLSIADYLALKRFSFKNLLIWIGVVVAIILAEGLISSLFHITSHSEWAIELYRNALYPGYLIVAIVFVGPLFEELLFRGFAFKGIAHSPAGPVGAIIITSIIWAAIHFQYGLYAKTFIFVLGIAFGVARWKSESVVLPFVLHSLLNFAQIVQIVRMA